MKFFIQHFWGQDFTPRLHQISPKLVWCVVVLLTAPRKHLILSLTFLAFLLSLLLLFVVLEMGQQFSPFQRALSRLWGIEKGWSFYYKHFLDQWTKEEFRCSKNRSRPTRSWPEPNPFCVREKKNAKNAEKIVWAVGVCRVLKRLRDCFQSFYFLCLLEARICYFLSTTLSLSACL